MDCSYQISSGFEAGVPSLSQGDPPASPPKPPDIFLHSLSMLNYIYQVSLSLCLHEKGIELTVAMPESGEHSN